MSIPAHTGQSYFSGLSGVYPRAYGAALFVQVVWLIRKVYPRAYGAATEGTTRLPDKTGLSPRILGRPPRRDDIWL